MYLIHLENLGIFEIRRNRQARKLSIRIVHEGCFRVTVPWRLSEKDIMDNLKKMESEILKLKKSFLKKLGNFSLATATVYTFLSGSDFSLNVEIIRTPNIPIEKYRILQKGPELRIFVSNQEHDYSLFMTAQALKTITQEMGKRYIPLEFNTIAKKTKFNYDRIQVRHQLTRWGSCSSKKTISLNARLVFLPKKLRDLVYYHELVHLKHPHHGTAFWNELEKYVSDAKKLDKELAKVVLPV
ncbi:MAG: M48 family peptidase [Candidatus Hydrogenedentota bacterium]|nr:MAG: M48 family peptidase [Candidatus Hydrogenedentota bacterium]